MVSSKQAESNPKTVVRQSDNNRPYQARSSFFIDSQMKTELFSCPVDEVSEGSSITGILRRHRSVGSLWGRNSRVVKEEIRSQIEREKFSYPVVENPEGSSATQIIKRHQSVGCRLGRNSSDAEDESVFENRGDDIVHEGRTSAKFNFNDGSLVDTSNLDAVYEGDFRYGSRFYSMYARIWEKLRTCRCQSHRENVGQNVSIQSKILPYEIS